MQARQWAQDVMLSMPTSLLKCSSNHIPSHERRSQAAFAAWHRPSLHTPMRNMSASSCRAAATPDVENLTEPCIIVRPAVLSELDDVAWLRAEAFYEDQLHQRYVGSFKRQFKEQEARSLQQRTRQRPGQAGLECVCLVAVKQSDSSSAEVVGTLDVEPTGPAPAQDQKVPKGAAYVLNVVVSSKHRRQGIGIMLMAAAASMAEQEWASCKMCARVSAQNHAAIALYKACGYQEESQEAVNDMPRNGGSLLGKELLMVAPI
ncbi:hypothetical protein CVIRNUC_006558 [Coccomyxa viridis]|uniref:N-acetyltransferase domain-containing protein n=1 Tax=Coccomyxa viridis TaxID=1274662 RepID=A0AAV1I7N2_9CHLO|nr:hypothetical protein CVIRNUC_006558 [Coccomyxa viridis]